jgi:hypothetical protein
MEIEWVPIVMFLSVALIFSLFFFFRFRTRKEIQQTLRAAIEQGQELTPDILDRLGETRSGVADLRRGVISVAVAIGLLAFGFLLGEEDALGPLLAISAFPFLIGLAYLGLWKFREQYT